MSGHGTFSWTKFKREGRPSDCCSKTDGKCDYRIRDDGRTQVRCMHPSAHTGGMPADADPNSVRPLNGLKGISYTVGERRFGYTRPPKTEHRAKHSDERLTPNEALGTFSAVKFVADEELEHGPDHPGLAFLAAHGFDWGKPTHRAPFSLWTGSAHAHARLRKTLTEFPPTGRFNAPQFASRVKGWKGHGVIEWRLDPHGKPWGARFTPVNDDGSSRSINGAKGLSPRGCPVLPNFSPGWSDATDDAPRAILEGERKAAAFDACLGIPSVSIGGIYQVGNADVRRIIADELRRLQPRLLILAPDKGTAYKTKNKDGSERGDDERKAIYQWAAFAAGVDERVTDVLALDYDTVIADDPDDVLHALGVHSPLPLAVPGENRAHPQLPPEFSLLPWEDYAGRWPWVSLDARIDAHREVQRLLRRDRCEPLRVLPKGLPRMSFDKTRATLPDRMQVEFDEGASDVMSFLLEPPGMGKSYAATQLIIRRHRAHMDAIARGEPPSRRVVLILDTTSKEMDKREAELVAVGVDVERFVGLTDKDRGCRFAHKTESAKLLSITRQYCNGCAVPFEQEAKGEEVCPARKRGKAEVERISERGAVVVAHRAQMSTLRDQGVLEGADVIIDDPQEHVVTAGIKLPDLERLADSQRGGYRVWQDLHPRVHTIQTAVEALVAAAKSHYNDRASGPSGRQVSAFGIVLDVEETAGFVIKNAPGLCDAAAAIVNHDRQKITPPARAFIDEDAGPESVPLNDDEQRALGALAAIGATDINVRADALQRFGQTRLRMSSSGISLSWRKLDPMVGFGAAATVVLSATAHLSRKALAHANPGVEIRWRGVQVEPRDAAALHRIHAVCPDLTRGRLLDVTTDKDGKETKQVSSKGLKSIRAVLRDCEGPVRVALKRLTGPIPVHVVADKPTLAHIKSDPEVFFGGTGLVYADGLHRCAGTVGSNALQDALVTVHLGPGFKPPSVYEGDAEAYDMDAEEHAEVAREEAECQAIHRSRPVIRTDRHVIIYACGPDQVPAAFREWPVGEIQVVQSAQRASATGRAESAEAIIILARDLIRRVGVVTPAALHAAWEGGQTSQIGHKSHSGAPPSLAHSNAELPLRVIEGKDRVWRAIPALSVRAVRKRLAALHEAGERTELRVAHSVEVEVRRRTGTVSMKVTAYGPPGLTVEAAAKGAQLLADLAPDWREGRLDELFRIVDVPAPMVAEPQAAELFAPAATRVDEASPPHVFGLPAGPDHQEATVPLPGPPQAPVGRGAEKNDVGFIPAQGVQHAAAQDATGPPPLEVAGASTPGREERTMSSGELEWTISNEIDPAQPEPELRPSGVTMEDLRVLAQATPSGDLLEGLSGVAVVTGEPYSRSRREMAKTRAALLHAEGRHVEALQVFLSECVRPPQPALVARDPAHQAHRRRIAVLAFHDGLGTAIEQCVKGHGGLSPLLGGEVSEEIIGDPSRLQALIQSRAPSDLATAVCSLWEAELRCTLPRRSMAFALCRFLCGLCGTDVNPLREEVLTIDHATKSRLVASRDDQDARWITSKRFLPAELVPLRATLIPRVVVQRHLDGTEHVTRLCGPRAFDAPLPEYAQEDMPELAVDAIWNDASALPFDHIVRQSAAAFLPVATALVERLRGRYGEVAGDARIDPRLLALGQHPRGLPEWDAVELVLARLQIGATTVDDLSDDELAAFRFAVEYDTSVPLRREWLRRFRDEVFVQIARQGLHNLTNDDMLFVAVPVCIAQSEAGVRGSIRRAFGDVPGASEPSDITYRALAVAFAMEGRAARVFVDASDRRSIATA